MWGIKVHSGGNGLGLRGISTCFLDVGAAFPLVLCMKMGIFATAAFPLILSMYVGTFATAAALCSAGNGLGLAGRLHLFSACKWEPL
jgi:hypothetical protein